VHSHLCAGHHSKRRTSAQSERKTIVSTNIFICGVGGQGIGLMGDVLCQTLVDAGKHIMATETHGVAQRGGIVTTHIRVGPAVRTPKIGPGEAAYVFSLERLEGARFAELMLREHGHLVYYDTVVQPQTTRAGDASYPTNADVDAMCLRYQFDVDRIRLPNLQSPTMQNVALLGCIAALRIVDGVTPESVRNTITRLLPDKIRDINLAVFDRAVAYQPNGSGADIQKGELLNGNGQEHNPHPSSGALRRFPIIAGA
ncbi:MAG: 2-oxoacid:acceptor oxidoreductase family protein, partial [Deltaproteobacteria bacterium]|nr:2-oxoacid:acceptor oxidoreductase family protein [Deltaproteobacteria bacterium]